jgi:hypothetical protein
LHCDRGTTWSRLQPRHDMVASPLCFGSANSASFAPARLAALPPGHAALRASKRHEAICDLGYYVVASRLTRLRRDPCASVCPDGPSRPRSRGKPVAFALRRSQRIGFDIVGVGGRRGKRPTADPQRGDRAPRLHKTVDFVGGLIRPQPESCGRTTNPNHWAG